MINSTMPEKERRKYKRVKASGTVFYEEFHTLPHTVISKLQRAARTAELHDISAGGAQILCCDEVNSGAVLRLKISLENISIPIWAYGNVVWSCYDSHSNKHRIGLAFLYLKPAQFETLLAITGDISHAG